MRPSAEQDTDKVENSAQIPRAARHKLRRTTHKPWVAHGPQMLSDMHKLLALIRGNNPMVLNKGKLTCFRSHRDGFKNTGELVK